jgi:N-acetyl sugar amidotransferase
MKPSYTACTNCVLEVNDDPLITFNSQGVCHYCERFMNIIRSTPSFNFKQKEAELRTLVSVIKKKGRQADYDCVVGLSGGADSTYVLYLCMEYGLRPLAVHYDNGWNSQLAVQNIEQIVKKLNVDLFTYVNDWEEYKDLQLAFLKASVVDIELITDQAIGACLFKAALKKNIRYVITGSNMSTEAILPESWYHWKADSRNIRAIHAKYGKKKLKTYPTLSYLHRWYIEKFQKIISVSLLNYIPYYPGEVKKILIEKLNWKEYGEKHFESVFTRFFQGYILPVKFGIDKRKAHYSTDICLNRITREEAQKNSWTIHT